jgi:hypothetical protein
MAPETSASEDVYHFEDDHYLTMASRTWLHGDEINLRSGMAHVANGQTSEILYCWLAKSRDPMSNRVGKGGLGKARWDMLGNVFKNVVFLILLWRNMQLDMCSGRHGLVTYWSIGLSLCQNVLGDSNVRVFVWDFIVLLYRGHRQ